MTTSWGWGLVRGWVLVIGVGLLGFACGGEDGEAGAAAEPSGGTEGMPPSEAPPVEAPPNAIAVAESYLRAGAAADETAVRAVLDDACEGSQAMMRVDAVRVMGVPMTIESLTVTPITEQGDTATVRYEVSGSAHGEGGETEIMGMRVQTGEVNVEGANQSGSLSLRRVEGQWLVGCGPAVAPRTG